MIIINQERILVYPNDDNTCTDAISGEQIKLAKYEKSFHTEASSFSSARLMYSQTKGGFNVSIPPAMIKKQFDKTTIENLNQVGYLMSFREYINQKLNIDVENVTLNQAKLLLLQQIYGKRILLFYQKMKKKQKYK